MAELIHLYEYQVAWGIYALAGVGCSIVWWKITSYLRNRGWRELARGLVLVLIYTPWYADPERQFMAPAVVVLSMDLLLEGPSGGLQGGIVLLMSLFFMLLALTLRLLWQRRPARL